MNPPAGVRVFERGRLSSNNILLQQVGGASLIDSGYGTASDKIDVRTPPWSISSMALARDQLTWVGKCGMLRCFSQPSHAS